MTFGDQARLLKLDRCGYQIVAETRRLIEETWTLLEESLANALRARETIRRSRGIIAEERRVWTLPLGLWIMLER